MTQLMQLSEATAARRRVFFKLVDATDGFTPETAVDLTAAFANRAGSAPTEVAAGWYYYELTAAEVAGATSPSVVISCTMRSPVG